MLTSECQSSCSEQHKPRGDKKPEKDIFDPIIFMKHLKQQKYQIKNKIQQLQDKRNSKDSSIEGQKRFPPRHFSEQNKEEDVNVVDLMI